MFHHPRGGQRGFGGRGRGSRGRGGRGGRGGASGGYGGRRERDCLKYKLLGKCDGKDTGECKFAHRNQVPRSYRAKVDLPARVPLGLAVGVKGENFRLLTSIAECVVTPAGKAAVEIVTSDAKQLPKLVETYKLLLSQLYPMGPGWCYLHHEGVSECLQGTLLHFQEYKGRLPPRPSFSKWPLYEVCIDEGKEPQATALEMEKLIAKSPPLTAHDTKEGAYQDLEKVYGASAPDPMRDKEAHRVKVIVEYQDHMKNMLKGGLEWLCDKRQEKGGYVAKLEARFGKVLWGKLPDDMTSGSRGWGIEMFADLLFTDANHTRIFNTDVREESAESIRSILKDDWCSHLETFDIKFTAMHSDDHSYGGKLHVRVKFERGKPKVLLARKNEMKTVIFDVISLHRKHDIRMSLNSYEVVKPDHQLYRTVNNLIRTLTLSNPDDCTISFVPRAKEWNVHYIRHKKWQTYVPEKKYMIAVSVIRECELDWPRARMNEPLELSPNLYNETHTEVEFQIVAWERAFGHDAGFPPELSQALHVEQPTMEASVGGGLPHPWQPEHILKDFEEVWEQLDELNETLGSP